MKIQNLEKVNISHVAMHALLIPCNRADLIKKVEPGVQDTVKIVTVMLSHDMDDSIIRVNDAVEMIGGNLRKMRKNIDDAIRISCEGYEGNFGRPEIIPADQFIYIVAALAIKELGRFADDVNEYTVMTRTADILDVGAIHSGYDMSCYVMMINYEINCLERDEQLSLTSFIKATNSPYATTARLKKFLKKNRWYDDEEELLSVLKIRQPAPTPSTIAHALFRALRKMRNANNK